MTGPLPKDRLQCLRSFNADGAQPGCNRNVRHQQVRIYFEVLERWEENLCLLVRTQGSAPTIPSQFPELFEIERAFLFFLRTGCLIGRSSRLRLFSSAPIVGTTALLGGTPSPTVRIAELRFFWSFGLLAIARASKIQVDSIGPRRSWKIPARRRLKWRPAFRLRPAYRDHEPRPVVRSPLRP